MTTDVVIVDDSLARRAITGDLPRGLADRGIVTTYSFHYRLVRALRDERVVGQLSSGVDVAQVLRVVEQPPADRLVVLDPRVTTGLAAEIAVRSGANLLLAELVAAAKHGRLSVRVASHNVGRRWPELMAAERIDFKPIA